VRGLKQTKGNIMLRRELCTTVRVGIPCIFMKKEAGCAFVDGYCRPTINECKGCEHIVNLYCDAYMHPASIWSYFKRCPLATHLEKHTEVKKETFDPRKAARQRKKQSK